MSKTNLVILYGNVGKDPEITTFNSGSSKATFTLATSSNYKSGDEWKTDTQWHNIEIWGNQVKAVEKKVTKGTTLVIHGTIKYESWEDKEGNKKYKTVINAEQFIIVKGGVKSNSETTQEAAPAPVQESQPTEGAADLPF